VLFLLLTAGFALPVSISNVAPSFPLKAGAIAPFLEITVPDGVTVASLPIQYRGAVTDVQYVQLWKETGKSGFDNSDLLVGSQSAAATVSFPDSLRGPATFYVVAVLASSVADGNTIQFQIPQGAVGEKSPSAFSGAVVIDSLPPELLVAEPILIGNSISYFLQGMDSNFDPESVKFFLRMDSDYRQVSVFSVRGGYQALVDIGQLADGAKLISYWTASDTAGNVATSATMSFTIDRTPPTIRITAPVVRKFNTSHVEIRGTVFDDSKGKNEPRTSSPFYLVSYDSGSGAFIFSANLSEGDYIQKVSFVDDAGNEGSTSISFSVDQTPPEISILSPFEDSITGISPEISVSTSENANCFYSTGQSFLPFNRTGSQMHGLRLFNLTRGYLQVSCHDEAGNQATLSPIEWTISNSGPQINQLSFSKNPAADSTEIRIVASTAGFNGPIREFRYRIDNQNSIQIQATNTTTKQEIKIVIMTDKLTHGSHTLVAEARDDSGWGLPSAASLKVDHVLPTITDLAKSNGILKFNILEENIYFVQTIQEGKPTKVRCDLQEGVYSCVSPLESDSTAVTIEVTDAAGNQARKEIKVDSLQEPFFTGQFVSFWVQSSNLPVLFGAVGLLFAAWILGTRTKLK